MRRVFEFLLISAMVLGSALGAQKENGVLVLDVYSVNVPSDVIHEKGFALWSKALKAGEQSSHEYVPVIHAVYRLGGAVYIDKHYKTGEGNEEQISVVGRVNPENGGVEYRVEFSELGRPPAYDGKTSLTIGQRERRVLVLPAVELQAGEKLETVVALEYKVEDKENVLKSKFEI
jgi:hypothetical protein